MLEEYEKNQAMSRYLKPGEGDIVDASAWISQARAARLRGVTRAAIASLVKRNRFKTLKIGDKTLLNRADIENFHPQPRGPKPKEGRNEAESTLSQGERPSSAQQNRGRTPPPGQRNKYLRYAESNDGVLEDYISQSEAARIRGVARQSIADLIERGRLTSVTVAGRTLVLRSEVENFVAQPKLGRPPMNATILKSSREKKPKK
jgi:predicted DNA-binding protein (UPF0251 family)